MNQHAATRRGRRSIRLQGFDYSQAGAYFVTICVQGKACLFGAPDGTEMRLNEAGRMVTALWDALPDRFPGIDLDAFVVMPNHVHGIIVITHPVVVGAPLVGAHSSGVGAHADEAMNTGDTWAPTRGAPTLAAVVGAFKSLTTIEFIRGIKTAAWPPFPGKLWQRNYHEHIIRHEAALHRIRQYIMDNPSRWADDPENPVATPVGAPLVGAHAIDVGRHPQDGHPQGAPLRGDEHP